MFKKLLLMTSISILFFVLPVMAVDCVEVDIELPTTIIPGPDNSATGYFELINCGDEAQTIWLSLDVTVGDQSFGIGDVPVKMGAGETISREFGFFAPPGMAGLNIDFCVTAVAGTAEATDCASIVVEESSFAGEGTFKVFGFNMASEAECVEVDLELPDELTYSPEITSEGYFELTNCGDESATIMLSVAATITISDLIDETFTVPDIPVSMGAGETISRSFKFPILPFDGVYTLCVTATNGEAVSTACQTVVVHGADFSGIPFNAYGTLIQGTDCLLFAPMGQTEYLLVLDEYGNFQADDQVFVSGDLNTNCETSCTNADACVLNNTIEAWGQPASKSGVEVFNYPNPFNPKTTIVFDLPSPRKITAAVYNVLGQKIKTLIDNELLSGTQYIEWNGTDDYGLAVSTGIYFYKLLSDEGIIANRKMMIIK